MTGSGVRIPLAAPAHHSSDRHKPASCPQKPARMRVALHGCVTTMRRRDMRVTGASGGYGEQGRDGSERMVAKFRASSFLRHASPPSSPRDRLKLHSCTAGFRFRHSMTTFPISSTPCGGRMLQATKTFASLWDLLRQHAPFSTLVAIIGFALFPGSFIGPYLVHAVAVFAFLFGDHLAAPGGPCSRSRRACWRWFACRSCGTRSLKRGLDRRPDLQ